MPRHDTDDTASRIVVSGHQVDVGDTLRAHATAQLEALGHKYFDRAEDATCTFSRTGSGGFACTIRLHSGRGLSFDGEAEHAAAPGAFVTLLNNKVRGSKVTAISLQAGARGQADGNSLHCSRGDCVCYSGDCSSRSNYVFANGAFRMRDTDCDD